VGVEGSSTLVDDERHAGYTHVVVGLHTSCSKWLKDRGVAILGSDAGSDTPGESCHLAYDES
jgi:hypothetical protein